jgi:anti-sigma factor RsiW
VRFLGFRRHPVSEEELSAYVDSRLAGQEQERVEGHLQSCADCSRELEEIQALVAEMHRLPETKAPRSFALSPEMAAATRREGDRARRQERTAARRVYLGLSGATAAAAVLLIAVLGVDLAPSLGGTAGPASKTTTYSSSRETALAPDTSGQPDSAVESGTSSAEAGSEKSGAGVAPGVAPLPSAAANDKRFSAGATPPPEAAPPDALPLQSQQAQPVAKDASHMWLWIIEGAAGGLVVGFGASAFWMRRRWVQINRS